VINYLNLLPLPVLDGGRILQRLAFTRWPLSDAVFSVIGALAMMAVAWWWNMHLLVGLGLVLLIGTKSRSSWRS